MNTVTLEHLKEQRDVIAQEASFLMHSAQAIRDLLSKILPSTKDFLKGFSDGFNASDPAIVLNSDQRAFLKSIKDYKYLTLSPFVAYVPAGLTSDYLSYLNILGRAVTHAVASQKLLTTYNTYLALLLTNRDQRFSTDNSAAVYRGLEATRLELNKELASCFKNGSDNTQSTYGKVVARNTDWNAVFEVLNLVNRDLNGLDRKNLKNLVNESSELLSRLINLASEEDWSNSAPEVLKQLADGAFQVASEVEFFSATYYRGLAITNAIGDTMKHTMDILASDETVKNREAA